MTEVGASSCLLLAETLQSMEQASVMQGVKSYGAWKTRLNGWKLQLN
jgi:hypothetical protein